MGSESRKLAGVATAVIVLCCLAIPAQAEQPPVDEILIWGQSLEQRGGSTSPVSVLRPADFASINAATTEDLVKFEPSLVIRRRFIGDANGTMGMRGANMFQTSRSMVFADGVPLHYFLQSRWNGSPRWTMVSASEIAEVQVLYGPFSAEYSGNAMGGVVLIESAIPQQREFHFDSSLFLQQFDAYGFDQTLTGNRSFFSYGDKVGELSVYLSYNRMENESQPQTFYFGAPSSSAEARAVSGGVTGNDEFGISRLWFGDTGVIDTATHNYKLKLGYELGTWDALLNIAYEDRKSRNSPNNYLQSAHGETVWSGHVRQGEHVISVQPSRFSVSDQDRQSRSLGIRLLGPVTDSVDAEINLSQFDILRDRTGSSRTNPADPAYTLAGQVTDFDDTGWQNAELKLYVDDVLSGTGIDGLSMVTGVRYDAYELNTSVYSSQNYRRAGRDELSAGSGGATTTVAAYAQFNWQLTMDWDVTFGGRYEQFRSTDGYYTQADQLSGELTFVPVPGQRRNEFSPKFTVGYQPSDEWTFRYSAARAYRFPIVEELFSQYQAFNAVNEANPGLRPEAGLHHNLMVERAIPGGVVRVNLFQETVNDAIEAQASTLPGGVSVRTFIPIDQVDTRGAEFMVNANGLWFDNLDLRFNSTYTHNEILENVADPSIVGNVYPRMPRWRGNLLATWHLQDNWNAGVNYQYASNSYGRNDNLDREKGVFGAQDGYARLGLKTEYRFENGVSVGVGVDNMDNSIDYVAHPWPGRTWYLNLSWAY